MVALLCGALLAAAPAVSPPVRLASPGWRFINVDEAKGEFFADYLAQQIHVQSGIPVTTRSEIAQLLGFERQKALLGCSDTSSSCLAELSGALGVDGLILGSLARFDALYVVNVKVIRASDGQPLAVYSERVRTETEVIDWLTGIAPKLAAEVKKLVRTSGAPVAVTPPPPVETKPPPPTVVQPKVATTRAPDERGWWRAPAGARPYAWIPAAGGAVVAVAGGFFWAGAADKARRIREAEGITDYGDVAALRSAGEGEALLGYGLVPVGAAALLAGAWMFFAAEPPPVALVPSPVGGAVVLTGVWP